MLNQVFSFFSSDTERELNNNVDNARRQLEEAVRRHEGYERKAHELGVLLDGELQIISKLDNKQQLVKNASVEYDNEFARASDARDLQSRTWTGIVKLTDLVCAPDFKSTRDNSLRAILQLLSADDTVFQGDQAAAQSEQRIHDAVNSKLGGGAVEKLKDAAQVPLEQFAVDWPEGLP